MHGLPGVLCLVETHALELELPVEQPADLGGKAGVGPVLGIDEVARPEAGGRALQRRRRRAADAIDRDAMEELHAAVGEREAPLAAADGLDDHALARLR